MADDDKTLPMGEGFKSMMRTIADGLNTRSVFGETQVLEGKAIIPVAEISFGGGGGWGGSPEAAAAMKGDAEDAEESGQGAGGGLGVKVKPLGVIEVTPEHTKWIPIVDVAKLVTMCTLGATAIVSIGCVLSGCRRGCCSG